MLPPKQDVTVFLPMPIRKDIEVVPQFLPYTRSSHQQDVSYQLTKHKRSPASAKSFNKYRDEENLSRKKLLSILNRGYLMNHMNAFRLPSKPGFKRAGFL